MYMHLRASLLLATAVLCGCQPAPPREQLDPSKLQVQARQLTALAAEADLFAQQLEAGHLNQAYAWLHQQSLSEQVGKAASELARPAPEPLRSAQREALQIAGDLRLALVRLAPAMSDGATLQALRRSFRTLQTRSHQLAEPAR